MNAAAEPAVARRPAKSAAAFRTISEVAGDLDVPQHVLRFWETKFAQVRPLKRGGGRRYYRPEDVDLLRRIRKLLYSDGYTIKGVQKLLREGGLKGMRAEAEAAVARVAEVRPQAEPAAKPAAVAKPESDRRRAELKSVLAELEAVKKLLGGG